MFSTYNISEHNQSQANLGLENHSHIEAIKNKPIEGTDDPWTDTSRIKQSLYVHKEIRDIDTDNLNVESLRDIAQRTNAAFIHYSYNCSVLANAMHYNLEAGKEVFCAKNVYPVMKGFERDVVEKYINKENKNIAWLNLKSLEEMNEMILLNHTLRGNQFYLVFLRFDVAWGEEGHFFNAAVLRNNEGEPYVAYVDAWPSFKKNWTLDELQEEYNPKEIQFGQTMPKKGSFPGAA